MEETRRCTSTVIPPLMNSVVVLGGGVVGEEDLRAATKRGIPIRNKKRMNEPSFLLFVMGETMKIIEKLTRITESNFEMQPQRQDCAGHSSPTATEFHGI
jgi:hypothetical protein